MFWCVVIMIAASWQCYIEIGMLCRSSYNHDSQVTYGFNLPNQALMHGVCLLTLLELLIYYNI